MWPNPLQYFLAADGDGEENGVDRLMMFNLSSYLDETKILTKIFFLLVAKENSVTILTQ